MTESKLSKKRPVIADSTLQLEHETGFSPENKPYVKQLYKKHADTLKKEGKSSIDDVDDEFLALQALAKELEASYQQVISRHKVKR